MCFKFSYRIARKYFEVISMTLVIYRVISAETKLSFAEMETNVDVYWLILTM